jgi:hypothetical protein
MINRVFDWCVQFLVWLGGLLGMSYESINVWIFCILWPVLTFTLVGIVLHQHRKIQTLSKK